MEGNVDNNVRYSSNALVFFTIRKAHNRLLDTNSSDKSKSLFQSVFKQFDKDRSGKFSSHELRQAFHASGKCHMDANKVFVWEKVCGEMVS